MRIGLISDIHGNIPALKAVLEGLRGKYVDRTYCLGDIVGYGPQPDECVDLLIKRGILSVQGNHDRVASMPQTTFSGDAGEVITWTREILTDTYLKYLGNLPKELVVQTERGVIALTHSSLPGNDANTMDSYMDVGGTARENLKIMEDRELARLMVGHTHKPGLFGENIGDIKPWENIPIFYGIGSNCGRSYVHSSDNIVSLNQCPVIIAAGSVGQPRDKDNRACYVVYDVTKYTVEFHRVEYDIEATKRAIRQLVGIDKAVKSRLQRRLDRGE